MKKNWYHYLIQARLDELLVLYPEEDTIKERYRKISEAMGTRTVSQVYAKHQNMLNTDNPLYKLNQKVLLI